ncbi:UDP-glycosyltransferase UGT5-like [Wyeomyia smithii]|uniref:UDP-glycosyltransferase UGT5-like n=1 Tax=Wyeomyia smithii TaxID=174621 RepID=UPI002467DDE0|nr:UDP-glycosyltransferase UGT5-like [Wyeomyia smithii]
MVTHKVVVLFFTVYFVASSESARILGVLPTGGKSHDIVGTAIMKPLAEAGHDVTVITAYPSKNKPDNYREIELTGLLEAHSEDGHNIFDMQGGIFSALMVLLVLYEMFPSLMFEEVMNHPNVVNLRNSDEKFDIVIVETFVSESFYGLAQHFDAQLVTFSSFGNTIWTNDLVATPAPYSHVAHFMLEFTDHMTFWQRFVNTAFSMFDYVYYELIYLRKQKYYYNQAFPNAKITFEQQRNNVSLVFLNQHFTLGNARPYPPNMVEIGGIQIEQPNPLPEDLQKYLDGAPDGVIYFCMGSNIASQDLPDEKREAFLRAFSKLKQKVLWKFENETIPNRPANLMIKAWMPQNDILAHPNVKLFITHGGNLGVTESLYHGKPLVGIPIFGDQLMNIARAVRAGYGVLLDFNEITEATVTRAITEVLTNPTYSKKARSTSERFRDKPMTTQQTVVHWVEYLVKHGASHFCSPAMDLSLLQYHLVDVYAMMLVLLGSMLVVCGLATRAVCRKIFRRKAAATDKRKKQA